MVHFLQCVPLSFFSYYSLQYKPFVGFEVNGSGDIGSAPANSKQLSEFENLKLHRRHRVEMNSIKINLTQGE